MTKEEVLNTIIERYKSQKDRDLLELVDCCYGMNCEDCPFQSSTDCGDAIAIELLDRLIKAEESQKAETNLEHYVAYYNNYDQCIYMDAVKLTNEAHRRLNNFEEAIEWLLEPYKPPKPKYKMSKFEYDLLRWYCEPLYKITDIWILVQMKSTGYFKDIPHNVSIKDIIDNCEVVDE